MSDISSIDSEVLTDSLKDLVDSNHAKQYNQTTFVSLSDHSSDEDLSKNPDLVILKERPDLSNMSTSTASTEWSSSQLETIRENECYFKSMLVVIDQLKESGPSINCTLPKAPKRKLVSIFEGKTKKRKTLTSDELHDYLIKHEIDTKIKIDKTVFGFPNDINVLGIEEASALLIRGKRQIDRAKALGLFFAIREGELLNMIFNVFQNKSKAGEHSWTWEDWLENKVGLSRAKAGKYRLIANILSPYKRFYGVGLSFEEIYNLRNEIKDMLETSESRQTYWKEATHDIYEEKDQTGSQPPKE